MSLGRSVGIKSALDFAELYVGEEVWLERTKREFFAGHETLNDRTFPATIFENDGRIKQRIIKGINRNTGKIMDYKMKNIQENNRRYDKYRSILEEQKCL